MGCRWDKAVSVVLQNCLQKHGLVISRVIHDIQFLVVHHRKWVHQSTLVVGKLCHSFPVYDFCQNASWVFNLWGVTFDRPLVKLRAPIKKSEKLILSFVNVVSNSGMWQWFVYSLFFPKTQIPNESAAIFLQGDSKIHGIGPKPGRWCLLKAALLSL